MISGELGAYAIDLGQRPLPTDVIHSAKRCFVDGMAAIISGAVNPPATLMIEALVEELDHGGAQIIPSGRRAPVRTAALINGAAAHTMEVDDIYRDAVYHPGLFQACFFVNKQYHNGRCAIDREFYHCHYSRMI